MMDDLSVFHTLDHYGEPETARSLPSSYEATPQEAEATAASFDDPGDCDERWPHAVAARAPAAHRRNQYAVKEHEGKDQLEALLAATAHGDGAAFEELYRLTSGRLLAILVRMVHNRAEAEELLQDTYTTAWCRAASFDGSRGSALTWLSTLARNRAIDRLRRHREHPLDEALIGAIPACAPTPDVTAETREICTQLEEGLRLLSAQQHRAIKSAFFCGMTYNELAIDLGVPPGTVKSWIRRGLAQLRGYLEP